MHTILRKVTKEPDRHVMKTVGVTSTSDGHQHAISIDDAGALVVSEQTAKGSASPHSHSALQLAESSPSCPAR